jgi:hypothetical protein
MTKTVATRYFKTLLGKGYKATLYGDYSGRGMNGRTTWGVVTGRDALTICPGLAKYTKDSMGMDVIFY